MNYFWGHIGAMSRDKKDAPHDCQNFQNRWMDFHAARIAALRNGATPFFYNTKSKILCAIVGYVSNLDLIKRQVNTAYEEDVAIIGELYNLDGMQFIEKLDGAFTIFIFDENLCKGFIFQDRFGSSLPVYYIQTAEGFSFSTSLKGLLKNTKFPRELDHEAAIAFLSDGKAVLGDATLLKNVKKLVPKQHIAIDASNLTFTVLTDKKLEKILPLSDAKKDLIPSIHDNIKVLFCNLIQKVPYVAVSSGYDSNFILYTLRKFASGKIGSLTIGGDQSNEIPQTLEILSSYQDIDSIAKVVPANVIQEFPDIVWRLEGNVFQQGVFLQYVLAKVLSEKKELTAVFLGEGADQILDQYRHKASKQFRKKAWLTIRASFIGDFYYLIRWKRINPNSRIKRVRTLFERRNRISLKIMYDKDLDFILKKNVIMLNSFGIQGLYAYLSTRTQAVSEALGKLNYKKEFFKKSVEKMVAPEVARLIAHKKRGGATDTEYLLAEGINSATRIMQSSFVSEFLNKDQIHRICETPLAYSEFVLQMAYLYLFNTLFVTGKFDSLLDSENMQMQLADFAKSTEL